MSGSHPHHVSVLGRVSEAAEVSLSRRMDVSGGVVPATESVWALGMVGGPPGHTAAWEN